MLFRITPIFLGILNLLIKVESPSLAKNDGPYGGDEVEGVKVGPPPLVGPMHFATVTL